MLSAGRRGFTLAELLAALAIIAALAAVILAQVVGGVRGARGAVLAQDLDALNQALVSYRAHVGRYPPTLAYLSAQPPAGATDVCGRLLPAEAIAAWRGPYVQRVLPAAGIPSADATIQLALQRVPADPVAYPVAELRITATGVEQSIADRLEREIDGAIDFATGTIRWTAAAGGTLTFAVPVRGC